MSFTPFTKRAPFYAPRALPETRGLCSARSRAAFCSVAWTCSASGRRSGCEPSEWGSWLSCGSKTPLNILIVTKVGAHQALPQLSVIRDEEVKQFVYHHIIADFPVQRQKFLVEAQCARSGTGCPLPMHGAHV